jgi:peroxiredoxin
MKHLFLISLFALSLQAGAQGQFVINGVLPDESYNGKMIYLAEVDALDGMTPLDSVLVVKNTFSMKGTALHSPKPAFVVLNPQQASIILLEPGEIMFQSGKISGTPANDKFQAFYAKLASIPEPELNPVVYEYLKENMANAVGEFLIPRLANLLRPAQAAELIKLARLEYQQQLAKNPLFPPAMGDRYIDVKLKNLDRKEASISDYTGKYKYVLIDFWASWCSPCIRENPTLLEAYGKYHSKGFEIIGLSLDEDHSRWSQAVKRLGITWPQLSDLGGWKSLAARTYKVNSIPASFLLNAEGVVIAKDLRGEELSAKLRELLGE